MKQIITALFLLVSSVVMAQVQKKNPTSVADKPVADSALGTWVIDLRPTPDSEPYLKDFKFTKIEGKQFEGEFYGYPFQAVFSTSIGTKSILLLLPPTRAVLIFIPAISKGIKFLVSVLMKTGNLCYHGKAKEKINNLVSDA
ncbi:MAG: hypothetical protein IPN56_15630 [Chitinophagaceae bacterium]|nr:hypothetical protein [Chitinophagaceae bacterium]